MQIQDISIGQKFFAINKKNIRKCRAVRENANDVFVYLPKKKSYGYRLPNDDFNRFFTICKTYHVDENKKWQKRISRAISALKSSGLWTDKLDYLNTLSHMSYGDKQTILDLYWNYRDYCSPKWEAWFAKYPFLKRVSNIGEVFVDTDYLFEMSDVKLESMYFGKSDNEFYKSQIKEALETKVDCNISTKTNYDVSYTYQPQDNKAWYSKEYHNCGNGYYYMALDNNVAWFLEKD